MSSASTQNQAFNAILFFYREVLAQPIGNVNALRAKRPPQFQISNLKFQIQMIARMLYGCGLRVSEPLNLRIKDVNVQARRLCIRGAKGGNDRVVALPLSLIPELTQQMHFAREVWQKRFALWDGAGTPKTQKNLGKHTVGTLGRLNHPPMRTHTARISSFSLQPSAFPPCNAPRNTHVTVL